MRTKDEYIIDKNNRKIQPCNGCIHEKKYSDSYVCKNCYVLMNGQRSNYNKSKIKWVKNE